MITDVIGAICDRIGWADDGSDLGTDNGTVLVVPRGDEWANVVELLSALFTQVFHEVGWVYI